MKEIANHELALWMLSDRMKKVFNYPMLHPRDIREACNNYVSSGCKSRNEFESIVVYLLHDLRYFRDILLEA